MELFETATSRWALDVNRVEFLRVDDVTFDVLGCLRERAMSVEDLVLRLPTYEREQIDDALAAVNEAQADGYFVPTVFRRKVRFTPEEYRTILEDRMMGLTISITSRCNLACSYCIFGGGYSRYPRAPERTMTWPVLKSALDFLMAHSQSSRHVRVLFFGGEPLVAYPLIRKGVDYLHDRLSSDADKLQLAICSNGTIMNQEILSFLSRNRVTLQVSLDGDRDAHDSARRFKRGHEGSFDTILGNLTFVHQRDEEYFRDFVRVKGVVQSAEETASSEVFRHYPLTELSPDSLSFIVLEPSYDVSQDEHYFQQLAALRTSLLGQRGATTLDELLEDLSLNQREFFWQSYGWFFTAQSIQRMGHRGDPELPYSKGCMIGAVDGHVRPDGALTVCDKAQDGSAFVIGHVESGWDLEAIDGLSTWLHDFEECSSCFVQRFCDLCYEKLQGDRALLDSSRQRFCEFKRRSLRLTFTTMLDVLDQNPALWDEVAQYINRRVASEREQRQRRVDSWSE